MPSASMHASVTSLLTSTSRNGPNGRAAGSPNSSVKNFAAARLSSEWTIVWLSLMGMRPQDSYPIFIENGVREHRPHHHRPAVGVLLPGLDGDGQLAHQPAAVDAAAHGALAAHAANAVLAVFRILVIVGASVEKASAQAAVSMTIGLGRMSASSGRIGTAI